MAGWCRGITATIIFLVHASIAIFLTTVLSNKERYGAPNDVHYAERFLVPLAEQRSIHRVSSYLGIFGRSRMSSFNLVTDVEGTWPILMDHKSMAPNSTNAFALAGITGEVAQLGQWPNSGGAVLIPNYNRCASRLHPDNLEVVANITHDWLHYPNRLRACVLTGQLQTVKVRFSARSGSLFCPHARCITVRFSARNLDRFPAHALHHGEVFHRNLDRSAHALQTYHRAYPCHHPPRQWWTPGTRWCWDPPSASPSRCSCSSG